MICVVVAADRGEKGFWDDLSALLCARFRTLCAYGGKLVAASEGDAELVLTDPEGYGKLSCGPTIAVCRDRSRLPGGVIQGPDTVAIVDSGSGALLDYIASTGLPAITCGLSGRDTVTLSSIGQESAVISLQRAVSCFDGTEAESQEIPVTFPEGTDSFALMAASVIALLAGRLTEPAPAERLKM